MTPAVAGEHGKLPFADRTMDSSAFAHILSLAQREKAT